MGMEFQESNRLMPTAAAVLSVTSSSVAHAIPEGWDGAYVSLRAAGADVLFKPGDASVAVDPADSDATKIGWLISPDATEDWRIPPGCTHLAVVTTGTAATLRWGLSSDKSQPREIT